MRLFVVAIKDRAVDAFNRPFFVPAKGAAVRAFQDEINRADGDMYKHPDDYDLFLLGEFDDSTGVFSSAEIVQLAIGKQMVIGER